MRALGTELLKENHAGLKFLVNELAIAFFPSAQQHRDVKLAGLSYEEDSRGNALAGLVLPERVEIRFHRAFSDERVRGIWSRVTAVAEIADADLGKLYYQGREIA